MLDPVVISQLYKKAIVVPALGDAPMLVPAVRAIPEAFEKLIPPVSTPVLAVNGKPVIRKLPVRPTIAVVAMRPWMKTIRPILV